MDLLETESDLITWTGIPSFRILRSIQENVCMMYKTQNVLKSFRASTKLLIVLVFVKLKVNLTFKQMSTLFKIPPQTISKYFIKMLPILRAALSPVIYWPSKEEIRFNTPKCFIPNFESCRVIFDCTEVEIEKPKSLLSRIKCYSHYKGRINAY